MGSGNALLNALNDKLRIDDVAPQGKQIAKAMIGVGALLAGLFSVWTPVRFWGAYLAGFCFLLSLTLGALFFVIIQHLTRAGWSVTVRRMSEILANNMIIVAVLFLPLAYGISQGYLHPKAKLHTAAAAPAGDHGSASAAGGHGDAHESPWITGPHLPLVKHVEMGKAKKKYLSFPYFMGRMALCFLIWIVIARFYLNTSVRQDTEKDPALTSKMQAWSAISVLLFGLTISVAAFDLLMALDPYWYSTMFGVYFFAGSFMSFFAALNVSLFLLRRKGIGAEAINIEHYHDTGKWMFAFTVFWAYVAFSQYMLIWYATLPEEQGWFLIRQEGAWMGVTVLLLVAHFLLPFLFIMSRWQKRRPALLAMLSVYMLCVHYLDMFWLIAPMKSPLGVVPMPLMDVFLALAMVGVYSLWTIRSMEGVNVIPTGDPRLVEAVHFHNQ
jgi:hypothetical protein